MDASERDLVLAKAALRRQVRGRRTGRDDHERARLAIGLRDVVLAAPLVAGARTIACYVSLRGEPGTGPLRDAWRAAGVRVLLPAVPDGDPRVPQRLDWSVDDGTTAPGPLGTRSASGARLGPDALADADVVLVPALLVDTLGRRLGQGGGFYDVTLDALRPAPPLVGLVHDDELVDADLLPVPAGRLDHLVDAVATPTRWWDVP